MNSFGVDFFQELLHLQFVQRLREIPLYPRQRQCLGRITLYDSLGGEKPEKNLERNDDQLDRRGRKTGAFALGKILTHHRQGHAARVSDFFLHTAPLREFAQRSVGGKLIIFRKTPLDCEKTNERVDRIFHRGNAKSPVCSDEWKFV